MSFLSFFFDFLIWGALLGLVLWGASFLENRAAMRGTHREPLSPLVDKAIRVIFLLIFASPLFFMIPYYFAILPVIVYLPSYLDGTEKKGNRMSDRVKNFWIWWKLRDFFNIEVVAVGGKLDPKKSYILGVHPHGFLPVATVLSFLTDIVKMKEKVLNGVEVRCLAASFCFYVPGYRDLLLSGGVIDAARYNARRALHDGSSLALWPGGATEGLYAHPGTHKLIINKRLGFIKLALEEGADLVPVYSFGETNCYRQLSSALPFVKKFQSKFQKILGLSLPLVTNLIPRKTKITIVVGAPIPVKKNPEPTETEVLAMLENYKKGLKELFDSQAPNYIENPSERVMEFVE